MNPRDFCTRPFGGAGPVAWRRVGSPLREQNRSGAARSGVTSALGLLVSNLKIEFSCTCLGRPPDIDIDRIATSYATLEAEALM